MMSFKFSVLKKSAQLSLVFWVFVYIVGLLFWKYKINYKLDELVMLVFSLTVFLSYVQLIANKTLDFLKIHSPSVLNFWKNLVLIVLGIVGINLFFVFCFYFSFPRSIENRMLFGLWDILSLMGCLIISLFSFTGAVDPRNQRRMMNKPLKSIFTLLAIYIFFIIAALLFFKARVLSYFFFALVTWIIFTTKNSYFKNSFYKPLSYKIMFAGILGMTVYFSMTGALEYFSLSEKPSMYLGSLDPKTKKQALGGAPINTIEDWYSWSMGDSFTADDVILGFKILEEICPHEYSDHPLEIRCEGSERLSNSRILLGQWSEEDILKFLRAENYYSNLFGIVKSRNLKLPLSDEIKAAITPFSQKPGNLSPVALKTLAHTVESKTRNHLSLKVYEKETE